MIDLSTLDTYGKLTEPTTLTIQRLLPGPIERGWAYLTESDLRRQWLASGEMALEVGSTFELVWRNHELTDPPGELPEGFSAEHRMQSRIVDLDPPRKLTITWGVSGEVAFELEPRGDKMLLTVTHRRIPDQDILLKVSAGWHAHLDILAARANSTDPAPFWEHWRRLHAEYALRIPA